MNSRVLLHLLQRTRDVFRPRIEAAEVSGIKHAGSILVLLRVGSPVSLMLVQRRLDEGFRVSVNSMLTSADCNVPARHRAAGSAGAS